MPVMISMRSVCSIATAARMNGSCPVSVTASVSKPKGAIALTCSRNGTSSLNPAQLSFIAASCRIVEALPLARQARQQRRWAPMIAEGVAELLDLPMHCVEADQVGCEHRSAAIGGEAVAIHINHVNVARPGGDPLFENIRAFVDQRIETALHDLLRPDLMPLHALAFGFGLEDSVERRVRNRRATSGLIAIKAGPGLLSEPAHASQSANEIGVALSAGARVAVAFRYLPAHIDTRHVRHGEGSHRKTVIGERLVDLRRACALRDEELGLAEILLDHPVAD